MEENASQQEQVTKNPVIESSTPASKPRQKDPEKVAAGKALARKNKDAREAADRNNKKTRQASDRLKKSSSKDSQAFSLSDNILKASALVGAGFTLHHSWSAVSGELKKRFESEATAKKSPAAEIKEPVEITPHT